MMKKIAAHLLYWLLVLPVTTVLLLEATLQVGSYANRHFVARNAQDSWLTSSLRVVAMGDSNTYGLYLKPEESYPEQLEALWNSSNTRKIEVINLGYPGTNSSRVLANLPEVLETFMPDIVLVMVGTNDSWTAPIPLPAQQDSLQDWIKRNSRTYRLWCLLTRQDLDPQQLETVSLSDPRYANRTDLPAEIRYGEKSFSFSMAFRSPDDTSDPHLAYQQNIESIASVGKKYRTRIIFLTYAADKHYYKQANKLLKEVIHKMDYQDFIDVTPAFSPLQPAKDSGNDYFFKDLHPTAAGNALLAREAATQLSALLRDE